MAGIRKLWELGRGGFSIVWVCERLVDGRRLAVKELASTADAEAMARFKREVHMLSMLDHPNVIKVLGKRVQTEPFWYLMPLYEHSLQEKLNTLVGDNIRIAKIFTSILDAVEYAHSEGVIHRDLKPENILMNNDSDVVVADFGIGLQTDSGETRQTSSGIRMGTEFYMAPEQRYNAKQADTRSDIFALGRILDELYRGPFRDRGPQPPELPHGISYLVERCTEQDPERRYQLVADLKQAYKIVVDPTRGGGSIREFTALRGDLSVGLSEYPEQKLGSFLGLWMNLYPQEDDLLVDTMLILHPSAIASLYVRDPGAMENLISEFCDQVARRGWPFSYTDHISNRCVVIFHKIDHPRVRAMLAACLVSLGASHNRWKVLRDAAGMISRQKEPEELLALVERLRGVSDWYREAVRDYLQISNLEAPLRGLFGPND